MTLKSKTIVSLLLLSTAAGSLVSCRTPGPDQFISTSYALREFQFDGRIDFAFSSMPILIWQASQVRFGFEGDRIRLEFAQTRGQCFFNVDIDGSNRVVRVPEGRSSNVSFSGLGPGRHRLTMFKRTEAASGNTGFSGVTVVNGSRLWRTPETPAKLKMEFIGDSITVGACNEDGEKDQWEDRRTHNAALSYAALTAEALQADYRNISVSGMGVVTGWVSIKAEEVWNRLYPEPSPLVDLKAWVPDVVLVNLGENDDSFPRAHQQPFPAAFTDRYVALIQSIRSGYPSARIVLLRGGMYGGAKSVELRTAWEAAVARLEAADSRVSHFVFTHWSSNHPRVADDRAMADELVAWLRNQELMRK